MKEKSIEELLCENARLRGDLLTIGARITHDLRTPLGSIVNTAELLKEIFKQNEIPAEFDSIFKSVEEMMQLIKSISLFAKASANPPPLEKINMRDAALFAWQRLERQILKRGGSVEISESWPEVAGVADWLQFVWWSFLSNAIRHGGRKIEMGWRQGGDEHIFFVRDDGAGVPPQMRAKLFQSFDSLHKSNNARGLGLSMARRLVELQNGRCGFEPEGGAFFYFTLPLNSSALGLSNDQSKCREVAA